LFSKIYKLTLFDFFIATEVDISDVKLEDEGDIDFQLALNKARKLKQKQSAGKQKTPNVS